MDAHIRTVVVDDYSRLLKKSDTQACIVHIEVIAYNKVIVLRRHLQLNLLSALVLRQRSVDSYNHDDHATLPNSYRCTNHNDHYFRGSPNFNVMTIHESLSPTRLSAMLLCQSGIVCLNLSFLIYCHNWLLSNVNLQLLFSVQHFSTSFTWQSRHLQFFTLWITLCAYWSHLITRSPPIGGPGKTPYH